MAETIRIYERVGHVEIDVGKRPTSYPGLDFRFNFQKVAGGGTRGYANISVLGLSRTSVNDLSTYLAAHEQMRNRKAIKVYAGYKASGEQLIYAGDIIFAKPSQPVDNWLTFSAQVNGWLRREIVSFAKEDASLRSLIEEFAKMTDASVEYRTDNEEELKKNVGGFDCTGNWQDILARINTLSSVKVMMDSNDEGANVLVVYDENPYFITGAKTFSVSEDSGMVGIPEFRFPSVRFKMLMNPYIHLFDKVDVRSKLVPNAGGTYVVTGISYSGHFRGTEWYMICECRLPEYMSRSGRN